MRERIADVMLRAKFKKVQKYEQEQTRGRYQRPLVLNKYIFAKSIFDCHPRQEARDPSQRQNLQLWEIVS